VPYSQRYLYNAIRDTNRNATYSLDHVPSDYYLLGNLKYHLHGNQFADDESLKAVVEAWFDGQEREFYFSRNKQHGRKVAKVH